MRHILVYCITLYQRYLSPRKGFACAHRRLYGGDSCSAAVKRILLERGALGGLAAIRARFSACRTAASSLPRADLDCGLSSCSSCDVTDPGSCFGGSDSGGGGTSVVILFVPLSLVIVIALCVYWFYGRQVDSIAIKLLNPAQEVSDRSIGNILSTELPDYQLILLVDGREIKTNIVRNATAADWLSLRPKAAVYAADIERITIVDKQVLKDRELDIVLNPQRRGDSDTFSYAIRLNWDWF